jgi:hypothetical protein
VIQGLTTRFNIGGAEKGQLSSTGMAWTLPNTITGSTDAIQLKVKGNATQTTNPFQIVTSADANILSVSNAGVITPMDGGNFVLGATTGTKFGTATTQKLSVYGKTPVVQQTALTTKLTQITHDEPGTPDYAIQALTQTSPYGFVTADEAQTLLKVVKNLQVRVDELETKLSTYGWLP